MNKKVFQVNYKKYELFYTDKQKYNIDYMNDWNNTIKRLKYLIKNNLLKKEYNVLTCYVASAIDNYDFFIENIIDNQFIIRDGCPFGD